eukprot:TRINITY_DN14202_c0_g1_i1.p2 TRINITY_DN14202_c0_g1~~TRINITY_DN14202_c0_g1_i1.p2  ORF type:complete len:112 (+),score=5.24 TRINITY_DN14202_c0_g1_i1:762-1097(+)
MQNTFLADVIVGKLREAVSCADIDRMLDACPQMCYLELMSSEAPSPLHSYARFKSAHCRGIPLKAVSAFAIDFPDCIKVVFACHLAMSVVGASMTPSPVSQAVLRAVVCCD